MNEKRYAVLIASSEYQDPKLENLRLPKNDVEGLNEVLTSEKYGNFAETSVFKNNPSGEVLKKINQVLNEAGKDDLVLIYFSGHGKLNRAGKLHLATINTEVRNLESTSIPVETIRSYIEVSASNKVVLILDSCFSGAAGEAFAKTKGDVDGQLNLISQGQGIYLMTSATGIQTALEKEGDRYGVFTKHIIEGIKSGEADSNDDSNITMDELYSYVNKHVSEESHQQPTQYNLDKRGDLVIARSGKSRRKERARNIKNMLFEQDEKGNLPGSVFSKSLAIIVTKPEDLSEEDLRYDRLLDQLLLKRIEMGRFIEEWYRIENERQLLLPERKPEPEEPREEGPPTALEYLSTLELVTINKNRLVFIQVLGLWLTLIIFYIQELVPNHTFYTLLEYFLLLSSFALIINGGILSMFFYRNRFIPGLTLGIGSLILYVYLLSIILSDYYFGEWLVYNWELILPLLATLATILGIFTLLEEHR